MRFTPWATRLVLTLSLSATAFLTACGGGGGSSSSTQIRLLNATQSYANLDLVVSDKTINSKVAQATTGSYGGVDTANAPIQVQTSDVGNSVAALAPTLAGNSNYTLIAYGFAGSVRTSLLQESQDAPDSGKVKVLALNLAPDAGQLDVYITTPDAALTDATPFVAGLVGGAGSGYIQLNAGTYRVRVTGPNNKTDLRLDVSGVTLDSATVNSLIFTSTSSGTLVNGFKLIQKGAVTPYPNSLSRVRMVNGLAGGTYASSTVQGQTLLVNSPSPNRADYISLPAGASNLVVNVNGKAQSFAAPNLVAGADYTLLLYGTAANPLLNVLVDDNRLPSTSGSVKIRLINGLSGNNPLASLVVDYTTLASNVQAGSSSAPAMISSTPGSTVQITSPLLANPLYNPGNNGGTTSLTPLTANGVYTALIMGDSTVNTGTTPPTMPGATGMFIKDR
ncbi:DUF4397 domain-containing protein [Roseateles sp.]|uniref:DUF4397 domain-containing protein n=1 Tax=Roseateles sp. TaxID=1971397 RepID=UPI0025E9EFBB|nr:DUF4397 domain-containing protein [Roseateles sp.]MBV8033635.1 DUF4397 domain-containing protein [Roseateles sp.]